MFFSVIVTIYNGEAFLAPCLDSILRNPAGNYEVTIIDDGSTDGTGKICDDIAGRYDHVRCVHTENQGVGNARQEGLDRATGEYVLFVDGDDAWDESFCLRKMEEDIKRNPADLYVFGYVLRKFGQDGFQDYPFKIEAFSFEDWRKNQSRFLTYFPNGLMFLCWNKIFRRQCLVEHDVVSVHQQMEDFRFVLEFLKGTKKVVFFSQEPYIYIKRGLPSLSTSANQAMLEGYNCCHRLFLSLFDKEHAPLVHQIMAPAYIGTIYRQLGRLDEPQSGIMAKKVLGDVHNNDLAQLSFLHYRANTFSEKVTVWLMRHGCYNVLREYRKLVFAGKRLKKLGGRR